MIHRQRALFPFTAALLVIVLVANAGCAGEDRAGASAPVDDSHATSIFNGEDLSGWKGDERFWRVEDGAIVGQTTPDTPTDSNTFLIWDADVVDDFELSFDFRMDGGNSGLQYRSEQIRDWVVTGYQADFDAEGRWTGGLYEEKGRGVLAEPGQKVVVDSTGTPNVTGSVVDSDSLRERLSMQEWNTLAIIADGNRLIHKVNGITTVDVTDNDADGRALEGILALQVHRGPPMRVEFKDVMLNRSARITTDAR